MPLPKTKKTLLKFRQPSVEDLVVSDDDGIQEETQVIPEDDPQKEIQPVNKIDDENEHGGNLGLHSDELTQVSITEHKMSREPLEEKKKSLKRKLFGKLKTNPSAKREKKTKTVEEILDEQDPGAGNNFTVLGLLMIVWFDGILQVLPQMIKSSAMKALRQKQFLCKKALSSMEEGLLKILRDLRQQETELEDFSLRDFVRYLQGTEFFTTYTQQWIPQPDAEWIMETLIDGLPEPSSLSSLTTSTSTSCMTALTQTIPADVPSCSKSNKKNSTLVGDTLEELFQHTSTASTTGLIQQSIAKRDGETVVTLKSPGERGYRVVKLDVYDYSKISGLPKEQWWKTANYRATFLTSSPVDPIEQMVTKILTKAATNIKEIPGVEKEAKGTKSFYSYRSDQRPL